ncbi:MAG: glycosyltransferase [Prevotella sp.]
MRVFHFISHFDLGGAERVAASIAKSETDGIEYHVVEMMRGSSAFTSEFVRELQACGVVCHRSLVPDVHWHFVVERLTALFFPLRFLWLWLRWHPDVVHSHTELPDLCTVASMKALPWIARRCKVVRTIHNNCLWTGQNLLGRACERFFIEHNSSIAISESVRQSYKDRFSAEPPIIYNGVGEMEQRVYNGLHNGKINVIFAGRFERQKGMNTLVDVVSALADDNRYHFHIFGDGSLAEMLRKGIDSQANVSINAPLFGLSSYLGSFDYMFMPSEFEGLSIVAIEASMARLPNIINSCRGLEETLPADWPLKVEGNDTTAYLHLFRNVIPTCSRELLGEKAHSYACEHFSVGKMRQGYEMRYRNGGE